MHPLSITLGWVIFIFVICNSDRKQSCEVLFWLIHLAMTFKVVWFTYIYNWSPFWLFNPLKYLSVQFCCRLLAGNTCIYMDPFMFPKCYLQGLICFCIFTSRVLDFCRNFLFCFLPSQFWAWCTSSSWSV